MNKTTELVAPAGLLPNGPYFCTGLQVEGGHLFKVTGVTYNFGFQKPQSWKIKPKFTELWVFSISSYLRSIRNQYPNPLELPMPTASNKMRALLRVAKIPPETD